MLLVLCGFEIRQVFEAAMYEDPLSIDDLHMVEAVLTLTAPDVHIKLPLRYSC